MPIGTAIRNIRAKPHAVRVRILFVCLGAIALGLIVFWALTFRVERSGEKMRFFEDIGVGISGAFSDPAYTDTFSVPAPERP